MRLFVALQFTKAFKDRLLDLGQELKKQGLKGSYTAADKLHLTLCFIGEASSIEAVIQALGGIEFRSFEIELTELGVFRDLLWVGTKEEGELRRLVSEIRSALDSAAISYDNKPFKSHITLVRRMEGARPSPVFPRAKMRVEGFSLMNSSQMKGRLTYTELASFDLKGLTQHPKQNMAENRERQGAEALWAEEKYLVLSKSQKIYNEIREYLKGEGVSIAGLKHKIEEAKTLEDKRGQVLNALQHLWGYFKKQAEASEREECMALILRYERGEAEKEEVLGCLKNLLQKYPNEYLEKSTIFRI